MSERKASTAETSNEPKPRPGRKRLGNKVFKLATMRVEPADLEEVERISAAQGRLRSDVMRDLLELGLAHREEAELAGEPAGDAQPNGGTAESRVAASFKADAALLAAIDGLAASGRGSRSAVVARLVREGLRRSGYEGKGGPSGD